MMPEEKTKYVTMILDEDGHIQISCMLIGDTMKRSLPGVKAHDFLESLGDKNEYISELDETLEIRILQDKGKPVQEPYVIFSDGSLKSPRITINDFVEACKPLLLPKTKEDIIGQYIYCLVTNRDFVF